MIHVDNAVELAGRLYLKMEARLQDTLSPNEVKELERYFDKLLMHLSSQLALDSLTRSKVEYFHDIRNDLYHNGNGISVDPTIVSSYITTANRLLEQMYDVKISFAEEVPETEVVSPVVTKSVRGLSPETVYAWEREFLKMEILHGLHEAVHLRYAVMGYQTEKKTHLGSEQMRVRADLICRKGSETIIVEIRKVDSVIAETMHVLRRQKELFERVLSAEQREGAKFRVHIVSTLERNPLRVRSLEQAGWEIEDWKTTLKVLSDNGLVEKAQPLERKIEEYMNLHVDKRQRRQRVGAR